MKKFTVLAIDDDSNILTLFEDIFENIDDMKVITASNGFLSGAKLVEEPPDLILLDFVMPELDGFEFCRYVRKNERFKTIPIIAISGLSTEDDFKKMREAGVDKIISKPFNALTLLEEIRKIKSSCEGA